MRKKFLGKTLQDHSLAMILCCAIPLLLIALLSATGTLGSWGFLPLILLCPVLHILMMRGHHSGGHERDSTASSDVTGDHQGNKEESI